MATVFDVSDYILSRLGQMTAMKLQKLVYYCQAWSLVWDEKPLFGERIEAWANGPVVAELFQSHKGQFLIEVSQKGDRTTLAADEVETIESVLAHYGDKTGAWLSDLTHREAPWLEARQGLSPSQRSNREITLGAMADYYGNL